MQRVDRHEDCGRHASGQVGELGDDQEQGHARERADRHIGPSSCDEVVFHGHVAARGVPGHVRFEAELEVPRSVGGEVTPLRKQCGADDI